MFATTASATATTVAAGTRPNLSHPHTRDDSMLTYSRTTTIPTTTTSKSLGNSGRGLGGGGGGSSLVPLSRLRDVLSDAGVQLGSDDAARLEDIVRRDLLAHPNSSPRANSSATGTGANSGGCPSPGADAIEPLISLDRFCSIIGVATVPHSTQSNTMELADPRYILIIN